MKGVNEIDALFTDLLSDLQQIGGLWQLMVLAASLGFAWALSRRLKPTITSDTALWKAGDHSFSAARIGAAGFNRVLFPLSALLLVLAGRALLKQWQTVHLLDLAVPLFVSLALIRVVAYMLRYVLPPSSWLSRSERIVAWTVWGGVVLYITGFLPALFDLLDGFSFHVGRQRISMLLLLQGVISLAVMLLLTLWLGQMVEHRIMDTTRMDINLRVVLAKFARALLLIVGLLIALPVVGIDITLLSVFGGAVGVGLGFGLQKIASNYVSGFIILLDRSISMGDMVTVDNRYGEVTQITARYVVVRSTDGTESIIPNDTIITSTVVNHSYSNRQVRIEIPVQISYESSVDTAMHIMIEAAGAQPRVLKDPEPLVLVKELADNGIVLALNVWIADLEQGKNTLLSDIHLYLLRAFREQGIVIPYPQREIRMQSPSDSAKN